MIRLVYGPPGAGKSTYIREHATPNDLVIDYDQIRATALSDVSAQRLRAVLEDTAHTHEGDVWIARTLPDVRDRDAFIDRVKVDESIPLVVDMETAKSRVLERDGDEKLFPAIERWFEKNTPVMGIESEESFLTEKANTENETVQETKVEHPNGFPVDTPLVEMTGEEREAYWKYHSRKHEKNANELAEQVKANEADAKAWREYKSAQDNPVNSELAQARKEVFESKLDAAAARAGVDISSLVNHLNMDSFIGEDGKISGETITALIDSLPSGIPELPLGLPNDLGSNDPLPKASGTELGEELFRSLHRK